MRTVRPAPSARGFGASRCVTRRAHLPLQSVPGKLLCRGGAGGPRPKVVANDTQIIADHASNRPLQRLELHAGVVRLRVRGPLMRDEDDDAVGLRVEHSDEAALQQRLVRLELRLV